MDNEQLRLEWVYPETLTPNPLNWRLHPKSQRQEFDALFNEVGWAGALLFNESTGNLIDGHLRREQLAGKGEPVPVLIGNWTVAQEKLILARLDPISALAETSKEMLDDLLHQIETDDPIIQQALSDMAEEADLYFDGLGDGEGDDDIFEDEPPVDKAEELQNKWGVRPGDVWQLGEHRVICGDCTDPAVVGRLMGGERAELMVTDPPYGVSYAAKNEFLNNLDKGNRVQTEIENDHLPIEETAKALWRPAFSVAHDTLADVSSFYCFMPQGGDQMMMMMMMGESGLIPRHELIWLKNNHVLGRTDYAYKHEPIIYGWKRKGTHKYYGGFQTSVLEFPKPQKSEFHPTMKPIALVAKLIENSSQSSQIVYDPFLGSGTTLIACEQLNRQCRGVEIEPKYVSVILERWQTLTGQTPERETS